MSNRRHITLNKELLSQMKVSPHASSSIPSAGWSAPTAIVVEPPQDTVKLHFTSPVEIYINEVPYIGKDVEVENYTIAAEVVRIAKEAYGNSII